MTGDRTLFLFIAGFLAYRCCDFIGLRHKLRQTITRENRRAYALGESYTASLLSTVCTWLDGASAMIGMGALLALFAVFGFARLLGSQPSAAYDQQTLSVVTVCTSLAISLVAAVVEALRLEQEQA